jgi:hypothetical protein
MLLVVFGPKQNQSSEVTSCSERSSNVVTSAMWSGTVFVTSSQVSLSKEPSGSCTTIRYHSWAALVATGQLERMLNHPEHLTKLPWHLALCRRIQSTWYNKSIASHQQAYGFFNQQFQTTIWAFANVNQGRKHCCTCESNLLVAFMAKLKYELARQSFQQHAYWGQFQIDAWWVLQLPKKS